MTLGPKAKEIVSGGLLIAVAAWFGIGSLSFDIGTAWRMGPGYFPLALSILLAMLGLALLVTAAWSSRSVTIVPVWGMLLVLIAPVVFALTVRGLGFLPATALTALLGAYASRKTSLVGGLAASFVLTAFCYLTFIVGLGLPLPLIGRWLAF